MTYTPPVGFNPSLSPSIVQYELYTQNGPMPLGDGIYITEDGYIEVDASNIPGVINCGSF
jgi:hypothetical protein